MKASTTLLTTLIALLLAVPVWSSGLDSSTSTSAAWQLAGTTVVLRSAAPYERGFVRVVGPDGYRAFKRFEAGTEAALDLLREGWMESAWRDRAQESRTSSNDHREETSPGEQSPGSLTVLPDGRYRLEAVLGTATDTVGVDKSVQVRGGTLVARASEVKRTRSPNQELVEATPEPSASTAALTQGQFAELVEVIDENDSGITGVDLQANDTSGQLVEEWRIENNDGDLRIVEKDNGSANRPRMTILQDKFRSVVGLGTTTPEALLHLSTINSVVPRLRIEDSYDGVFAHWDLRVRNSAGGITGNLSIRNPSDVAQVVITAGAPEYALWLDPGEVRVGTGLSVLSSRAAKTDLAPVDSGELLARLEELPIFEWEYREADGARHLGPTAEDFRRVFPLGSSDRMISPMDLGGVALAAIQGLQEELNHQRTVTENRLAAKERTIGRLIAERDQLEVRLDELEAKVEGLLAGVELPGGGGHLD